jgi:hypothetical protein
MEFNYDVKWMDEPVEKLPTGQGFYRLMCLLRFKRRLTYSDLYVFTYALNKNKFKDKENELKIRIIKELAAIYLYNNKKLPEGFELKFEK